jgi:hypothetical protein
MELKKGEAPLFSSPSLSKGGGSRERVVKYYGDACMQI